MLLWENGTTFFKIYGEDIDESSYAIYVEDNGEGIEDETLQQLNEKIYANSFELLHAKGNQYMRGIGLVNVHSRTRLRYGEAYGLRVDHSVTGGVVSDCCFQRDHDGIHQGGVRQ